MNKLKFILGSLSLFLFFGALRSQTYKGVKIGDQVWMAENLHVFYFRNGDPIPVAKSYQEWEDAGKLKQPACCYYENNPENGKSYGLLYNFYAIIDPRGLAPKGWHIPQEVEWEILNEYINSDETCGSKLKSFTGWDGFEAEIECGTCKNWRPEQLAGKVCNKCSDTRKVNSIVSGNGSNVTQFSALPAGFRNNYGGFQAKKKEAHYWSANSTIGRSLKFDSGKLIRSDFNFSEFGLSVRCVKGESINFYDEEIKRYLGKYDKEAEVFTVVEQMPEYPGGVAELMKYLQTNIIYPENERLKGITGKCVVKFIVEPDGSISNAEVIRGVPKGPECDAEALRVVMNMPNWSSGKLNGKPVRVYFNLPINFQLR